MTLKRPEGTIHSPNVSTEKDFKITSIDEDVQQSELLYTASGSLHWHEIWKVGGIC